MKAILLPIAAAALVATAWSEVSPANPQPDQTTIAEKARDLWTKSKGYLSEDLPTYKAGAQQTLTDLGKEIDTVTTKAGATPPLYFQTRLQSLKQQHEHLGMKLAELDGAAVKTRMSGPRYAFDRCVASLEAAIDQADDEADVLAKVASPAKQVIK